MKISGFMVLALGVSAALLTSRRGEAAGAACEAVSCEGDADCGAGTRCVAGADPNCVADGGSICGLCVVSWQAACQADSDCGDGFVCAPPGQACACSDAAPDDAMGAACGDATSPLVCEAGGACLDGAACDAGTCLCATPHFCTVANAPCPATGCQEDWTCVADVCVPPDWSCEAGTCEPPCFGEAPDAGPLASTPPEDATVSPGYANGKPTTCGCRVVGADPQRGDWGWLVIAGVAMAMGRRRMRRRRASLQRRSLHDDHRRRDERSHGDDELTRAVGEGRTLVGGQIR